MAKQLYRPFYLIAMAGALSTAGCQSGASWRSPSTWFAARQPDPAVIAGRTETPQMPQSPAEKYAPTALANKSNSPVGNSAVGQVPVAGQVPAPGQVPGVSSQPAYGNTPQMANTVKTTVPAPTGGLAALSNGYQTGPYGMATQPGTPTAGAPTTGTPVAGTTVANQTASSVKGPNSFANPYGGTFATATSSPATAPSTALPASAAPYGSTGVGLASNPATNSTAPAASNYPALPGAVPTGPTAAMVSGPSGSVPGSLASLPYPSINSTPTAPTTSVPAGSVPAASAYPAVAPASAYAPGTTGRTTNYNFGVGSATTAPTAGQSPTMGLPPNTATGGAPQLIR
jgi:hypothetical protein